MWTCTNDHWVCERLHGFYYGCTDSFIRLAVNNGYLKFGVVGGTRKSSHLSGPSSIGHAKGIAQERWVVVVVNDVLTMDSCHPISSAPRDSHDGGAPRLMGGWARLKLTECGAAFGSGVRSRSRFHQSLRRPCSRYFGSQPCKTKNNGRSLRILSKTPII
jgi:hypothetical protein